MNPTEDDLRTFRATVYPDLTTKGIKPPSPGSQREVELFTQWRHGKEKLNRLARKVSRHVET